MGSNLIQSINLKKWYWKIKVQIVVIKNCNKLKISLRKNSKIKVNFQETQNGQKRKKYKLLNFWKINVEDYRFKWIHQNFNNLKGQLFLDTFPLLISIKQTTIKNK
jgi:predicted RNA-binding protein with RPS1 domain